MFKTNIRRIDYADASYVSVCACVRGENSVKTPEEPEAAVKGKERSRKSLNFNWSVEVDNLIHPGVKHH